MRLIFTLIVTSFGIALYLKNFKYKFGEVEKIEEFKYRDAFIIMFIGVFGGIFSSITGTGIHFIIFSFVTLLYRIDEKVATPTSILIMAWDSIFGFIFRKFVIKEFSDQALQFWMLCIPIVALFGPLGAIVCSKVNRVFIVKMLLFLISMELLSTVFIYKFNLYSILISVGATTLSLIIYLWMIKLSQRFNSTIIGSNKNIQSVKLNN